MEAVTFKTIAKQTRRVRHTVKCPTCHRKLCDLSLEGQRKPHAVIQDADGEYDLELRCASCKAYVGVTFY
jgi:uncharacterized protein with PIN domain